MAAEIRLESKKTMKKTLLVLSILTVAMNSTWADRNSSNSPKVLFASDETVRVSAEIIQMRDGGALAKIGVYVKTMRTVEELNNDRLSTTKRSYPVIEIVSLPMPVFVYGVPSDLADGETWQGDVYPAGTYRITTPSGDIRTFRAFATTKELAKQHDPSSFVEHRVPKPDPPVTESSGSGTSASAPVAEKSELDSMLDSLQAKGRDMREAEMRRERERKEQERAAEEQRRRLQEERTRLAEDFQKDYAKFVKIKNNFFATQELT